MKEIFHKCMLPLTSLLFLLESEQAAHFCLPNLNGKKFWSHAGVSPSKDLLRPLSRKETNPESLLCKAAHVFLLSSYILVNWIHEHIAIYCHRGNIKYTSKQITKGHSPLWHIFVWTSNSTLGVDVLWWRCMENWLQYTPNCFKPVEHLAYNLKVI